MAQPHRPAAPSTPSTASTPGYPGQSPFPGSGTAFTGVTEGLPASVTATSQQVGAGPATGQLPPADPYGRPRLLDGRRWFVLGVCALLGVAIGVVAQRLPATGPDDAASPTPSASATATVPATVTAVAAKGSSFTQRDGSWRSETYRDARFGSLKKGIGLRLDLGSNRPLTAVTFTADTGPLTVELRAGDTPATDGGAYQLVGSAVQATGATTLPATRGGSHRYWMIWVTQLPPSGFQARITSPVAKG